MLKTFVFEDGMLMSAFPYAGYAFSVPMSMSNISDFISNIQSIKKEYGFINMPFVPANVGTLVENCYVQLCSATTYDMYAAMDPTIDNIVKLYIHYKMQDVLCPSVIADLESYSDAVLALLVDMSKYLEVNNYGGVRD